MATSTDYANALRYGPQAGQAIRRSQYLADALKQMQEGSEKIQTPGELGARLLATAILKRSGDKATAKTVEAVRADQQGEAARILAGFDSLYPKPAPPQPQPAPQAALPSVQTPPPPSIADPSVDAIVRTVLGEAARESPEGQAAVASVILNRAKRTGKSPTDIVFEPHQFEPWGNPETRKRLEAVRPDSTEYQAVLRNISPALAGQDVTGGADHFYSPTAQASLGRKPPKWDNGTGRDLGRHRFFSLGYGGLGAHRRDIQPAQASVPPPPPPPNPNGPDFQPMQSFQVAAAGDLQPGMIPSASAPPPAPAGTAPAASPQAAAGVTYLQPTAEEVGRVRSLMADPRTFEAGKAYAMELQKRAVTPVKRDTQSINGMPFQVDPYTGNLVPLGVPDAARTRVMTAQQAGLQTAPQGLYVQQSPLGDLKEAPGAPPSGFNAGPNGYAPIAGGPADPYAPQKPSAGYEYSGGRQVPIAGSAADPRNINNILAGTRELRGEIKTVVDQALQVKRNIDSVRSGYGQKNGAGDIAMINGLQRMIDEGVVREGDVALQLKAQGLAGSVSGVKGYLTSEGFFTDPKIRDSLMTVADSLYSQVNDNYKARVIGYKPIADRAYGDGTFEAYVFTPETAAALGWTPGAKPPPPPPAAAAPPPPKPGTREAAIAEARRRNLIK